MKTVGALIFPQFELLDLFGPLEMLGMLSEDFTILTVAEGKQAIASAQGPRIVPDESFARASHYDVLLVPGGRGTRREVDNPRLLSWLRERARSAETVASVCTGSALLAKAGVLEGVKATTNKRAFAWVRSQGSALWEPRARWVEDGKFFTSSGVSAGIDMSLALIARTLGSERAAQVATWAEYEWHSDPNWDPFAELYGLTGGEARRGS